MVSMPFSRASCGVAKAIGSPPSRISPESCRKTPEIALMMVDLPAPLSPASATTSPGWTSTDTPFSACTAPKAFETSRTDKIGSASLNNSSSHEAPLSLVDQHRNDDDNADGDKLPERLDVDEDQTVLDDRDDEGAGGGGRGRARTPEQARTPNDHGRDGVEEQGFAGLGRASGEAARVHCARNARHHRRQKINSERQPFDIDAGAVCRRLAGAERVGVLAKARLRKDIMQDEAGNASYDNQDRNPKNSPVADRAIPVVVDGDSHPAGEEIGGAARNPVHAERAYERRDLQAGDQKAVDEAGNDCNRRPAKDCGQHREEGRQAELRGEKVARVRRDHRRQTHHEAERQVDARGDDDEGLAERQEERRGGKHQNRLDVVNVEEKRRPFSRARPDLEEDDEHDKECPRSKLREPEQDRVRESRSRRRR